MASSGEKLTRTGLVLNFGELYLDVAVVSLERSADVNQESLMQPELRHACLVDIRALAVTGSVMRITTGKGCTERELLDLDWTQARLKKLLILVKRELAALNLHREIVFVQIVGCHHWNKDNIMGHLKENVPLYFHRVQHVEVHTRICSNAMLDPHGFEYGVLTPYVTFPWERLPAAENLKNCVAYGSTAKSSSSAGTTATARERTTVNLSARPRPRPPPPQTATAVLASSVAVLAPVTLSKSTPTSSSEVQTQSANYLCEYFPFIMDEDMASVNQEEMQEVHRSMIKFLSHRMGQGKVLYKITLSTTNIHMNTYYCLI